MPDVTVTVKPNGPLLVVGPITLIDPTGNPVRLAEGRPVAFCRCGQSAQKPFCDGAHGRTGFVHCDRVADRI
jgi:CDGSH-type Zn-finger protein